MGNLTTYKFFSRNRLEIHVEIISLGQMGSSDLKLMVSGGGGVGSPIGSGKMGQNGQNGCENQGDCLC